MGRRRVRRSRTRAQDNPDGTGGKAGTRSRTETEVVGIDKLTDVKGVGPKTTTRLAKSKIFSLKDIAELTPDEIDNLAQKSKVKKVKLLKIRQDAKEVRQQRAALILKQEQKALAKERTRKTKRLIGKRKSKKVPRASMMKHQLKEYLYRAAKEHHIAAPDDLWDEYSANISWNEMPYDEAWDLMYKYLRATGLETEKVRLGRVDEAEILKQERFFVKEHFVDEFQALRKMETEIFEELSDVQEKDPELAAEIAKESESSKGEKE